MFNRIRLFPSMYKKINQYTGLQNKNRYTKHLNKYIIKRQIMSSSNNPKQNNIPTIFIIAVCSYYIVKER